MPRMSNTVEYFPHFANASTKMTLLYLEGKYQHKGYALWFKLLECLASTDGHYLDLNLPLHQGFLTERLRLTYGELTGILQELAEISAIDRELWTTHLIVWSDNFVSNLSTVYSNRHRNLPTKPSFGNNGSKPPTANLRPTYSEDTDISRGSRVEEVEEVEEVDKTCRLQKIIPVKDFDNVSMKEDDYQKLIKEFGEVSTRERIEKLSLYKRSKGKKYKDDYATILTWDRMDKKKEPNNNPDKFTQGKYGGVVKH